jgi:DNA polymerase I
MTDNIILLIDGSNLAHKLYHALGAAPHAEKLRILTRQVDALAAMHPRPRHVAIMFDSPGPSWRRELYPEYKGTRASKPAGLVQLLAAAEADLHARGFDTWTEAGVEADDLIATRWQHARDHGHRVAIVSADRDLFQLLRPDCLQLLAFRTTAGRVVTSKWQTFEAFVGAWKFTPPTWPLYKAIAGDKSDNIPGIKGLGPSAAAAICERYCTLEDAVADRWKLPLDARQMTALDNAVRDGSAERYLRLCTLDRHVPIMGGDRSEPMEPTGTETHANPSAHC